MKLTREVKTGILAVGSILLFIFGYSFLKGTNLLENNRTFYVKYQNVEGLAKSAPVTINGLTVGKVQHIRFANDIGGLVVEFTIDEELDFSKSSLVQIYGNSLLGGKSLGILPVYDSENIAVSGDTLKGEVKDDYLIAVSKALGPLEGKVNYTLKSVDSLVSALTEVFDEPTRNKLQEAITNLNGTLKSFRGASKNLEILLADNKDKIDRTFTNLDQTTSNFAKLSDSLAQLETGKLVNDLQNVVARFDSIVTDLNNGEGSMGKLLKDQNLYDNLEGASKQLEELLQDFKLNPKRYVNVSVFGKKQKEYVKPEDQDQ